MYKLFWTVFFLPLLFMPHLYGQKGFSNSYLPIHHAPDKEFHMIHLGLDLRFNIPEHEIIGKATEKIVPLSTNYHIVHLDASEMNIKSVYAGNKKLNYNYDGKILSIDLNKSYGINDTLVLSVYYSTIPPRRGVFFIMPDSGYPDVTPQIWSQSEAEDARFWYPCHDYPDDFSTSSITVTVPEDWTTVSNGMLDKVITNKSAHTKTFYWNENKPHVIYLNSIVAGKFEILKDKWKNIPIEYYVEPEDIKDARKNFSHTPDILEYFSKITGCLYPWEKLSLSGVSQFTAGGMENVSAITLTDRTFHGKNAYPEETVTDLVSHETAHQWFGDLLTCRNWSNIWLNEGFATYFEALYGRHAFGKDHFIYEMYKNYNIVIRADKRFQMPTVDDRYNTADDAFGVNVYERGASILNMLRNVLGDNLFFKAIRYYVKKNQFNNVDTHDFETAVRETTGKNLYWFYNEWLYKSGHPVFDVKYKYDAGKLYLNVAQTQKVDSLTPVYKMPVDVLIVTSSQKINKRIQVDSLINNYVFNIPGKPLMVNFDEGNVLLKEINFEKSTGELAYQLKNDANVAGKIWAAGQLALKNSDISEKALITGLKESSFGGVRAACAIALGNYVNVNAKNALFEALKDKDPEVCIDAVKALGSFKEKDVAGKLGDVFNNVKNYEVKAETVSALSKINSSMALPIINKALKLDSYRQIVKIAALNSLARIDSEKAFSAAEKLARYGSPLDARPAAIRVLTKLGKGNKNTESLLEKYSDDPFWEVRIASIWGLGKIGGTRALNYLKSIESKTDDYRIEEDLKFSIKEIENRLNLSKK